MDFFGQQAAARRATRRLLVLFGLATVTVIVLVYVAVATSLSWSGFAPFRPFWDAQLMNWVAGITASVIFGGALLRIAELRRGGGAAVARRLAATEVTPDVTDPLQRKFRNVVEEMAIASGLPVPRVFVLDDASINAFAAGWSPHDAIVAVTRGCLDQLTRDELQGVVAHEFSHVCNGDMRLNIRMMGLLNGLLCIAVAGRTLLFGSLGASRGSRRYGSRERGQSPAAFLGLALIVIGWIGATLARLIKAAISRQREFLADASAVQFTRNPRGIVGALKRIGGFRSDGVRHQPFGARIANPHAEEASHMFFGDALCHALSLTNWLHTHPPLEVRIQRIEPGFHPDRSSSITPDPRPGEVDSGDADPTLSGFAPQAPRAAERIPATAPPEPVPVPTSPELMIGQIGAIGDPRLGRALIDSVPTPLRDAARRPQLVQALIRALALSTHPVIRRLQITRLDPKTLAADEISTTLDFAAQVEQLDIGARLPLLELAWPALRARFADASDGAELCLRELGQLRMDLPDDDHAAFVLSMVRMARSHLRSGSAAKRRRPSSFDTVRNDRRCVLATLARIGHSDDAAAIRAFEDGMTLFSADRVALTEDSAGQPATEPANLTTFDQALDRLSRTTSHDRRRLLTACARSVASDGVIEIREHELLRAIALSFDLPMPPLAAPVARPDDPEKLVATSLPNQTQSVSNGSVDSRD